jgi:hypothetical protein
MGTFRLLAAFMSLLTLPILAETSTTESTSTEPSTTESSTTESSSAEPLNTESFSTEASTTNPAKATTVSSGSIKLDLGLRASIYDDNYEKGLGGELGMTKGMNSDWVLGLHLNYTYFRAKTELWDPVQEFGGYLTAYYLPKTDLDFSLQLGPHLGFSHVYNNYIDVGGDLMASFQVQPQTHLYVAFVPAFFIGTNSQALIRIGIGAEYNPGW